MPGSGLDAPAVVVVAEDVVGEGANRALVGGLGCCVVGVGGDDFDSVQSLQMKEGKMPVIDRITLR